MFSVADDSSLNLGGTWAFTNHGTVSLAGQYGDINGQGGTVVNASDGTPAINPTGVLHIGPFDRNAGTFTFTNNGALTCTATVQPELVRKLEDGRFIGSRGVHGHVNSSLLGAPRHPDLDLHAFFTVGWSW